MATRQDGAGAVGRQLETLFNLGAIGELTDGQLLERFSTARGEVAELAFAALVERHGAMVLRVCRARLSDHHDTQDAFQATFLILVRKARGLWVRDSLGPWLHQVAHRTATAARAATTRRRWHESQAAEFALGPGCDEALAGDEIRRVLHEEIDRLPERYRVPIVLCDLEGQSCEEAARQMGRPVGTIKSWRARGRQRLRERLVRLGLAPSTAIAAVLAAENARAAAPTAWAQQTVRAAARLLSNRTLAGTVPAPVCALVKGVTAAMFYRKLRTAVLSACALGLLAAGLAAAAQGRDEDSNGASPVPQAGASHPGPPAPPRACDAAIWRLSLDEAIRVGLANSHDLRMVASPRGLGVPEGYSIAPAADNADLQQFRSTVMGRVLAIGHEYWSLAENHVQLWIREKELELVAEVKAREESEHKIGRGTLADVAEATQRLEQVALALAAERSEVIATERSLRKLLGLPSDDNRCIATVSAPTTVKVSPDWDVCVLSMRAKDYAIVRATARLSEAERLVEAAGDDMDARKRLRSRVEQVQADLLQTLHERTHSLARYFLETDSDFKSYERAMKERTSAAERLESSRSPYEQGKITTDNYLAAVSRYGEAMSREIMCKIRYNVTLLRLDEVQGMLLEQAKIDVVRVVDQPEVR